MIVTIKAIFQPVSNIYSFNIDNSNINVNDVIQIDSYPNAKIRIEEILDEKYDYVDISTKQLTNEPSTKTVKIKTISNFKKL